MSHTKQLQEPPQKPQPVGILKKDVEYQIEINEATANLMEVEIDTFMKGGTQITMTSAINVLKYLNHNLIAQLRSENYELCAMTRDYIKCFVQICNNELITTTSQRYLAHVFKII